MKKRFKREKKKEIVTKCISFAKKLVSSDSEVSTKRTMAWFIVFVLCGGLFTDKAELVVDWLGIICITCIGGNVGENIVSISKSRRFAKTNRE